MKTILLIATIAFGIVFPITEKYSFLIKYLLMIMLFFSFLSMSVRGYDFKKSHLSILAINILSPLIIYYLLSSYNLELAQVMFITAIAPTAIASPIIVKILNKRVEYTVISILVTNFSVAALLPVLLPIIISNVSDLTFLDVMVPVVTVFLVPYGLAAIIKHSFPGLLSILGRLNKYVFYILILNINLGTAKASSYIRQEMSFYEPIIYEIAAASLILCIFNFFVGSRVSPPEYRVESGQSLGQKNNGFTVWVALTFISPVAVLGPVFYILFQNIYISWQLHRNNKGY